MQDLKNRPMLPVLRADWASSGRNPSVGGKDQVLWEVLHDSNVAIRDPPDIHDMTFV